MSVTSAWGLSAEETFIKEFKKNGVEVIAKEMIETTSTDFSTPLTKLRSSNPDALVLAAYPDQAGLIKKQQVELGWDVPTLAQGQPVAGQAFTQLGGAAVEGTFGLRHARQPSTGRSESKGICC